MRKQSKARSAERRNEDAEHLRKQKRTGTAGSGRLRADANPASEYTGSAYPEYAADDALPRIREDGTYGTELDVPVTDEAERQKRRKKRGRVFSIVSYFFVLIFLSLIGYMVYFNVQLREEILRSPYNTRQDALAVYATRGRIESADGELLAESQVGEDGSELRVYPQGRVFSHVVGYDTHGKSGVENIANYELLTSHESLPVRLLNDFSGKKNRGDTVVTTLRADLQKRAYEALGDYKGAIVIIDPKTGAILSMVSKPDFDPNAVAAGWDEIIGEEGSSVLVNRATQGRYAPGSTFKIVTALAYYRKHGSFDGFRFQCNGELTMGAHTVHCYERQAHGDEDFTGAFSMSCNCAFATIGVDLGSDALKDAAETMLFNKKLQAAGLYANSSSFTLGQDGGTALTMQTAFGQGNTLTSPYHMALLASAISMNGVLMQPYLVQEIRSADGATVRENTPHTQRTLLSADEAAALRDLMRNVVARGTATTLSGEAYTAAGKTGSAEYVRSDGTLGTHSWFVGFAEREGSPDLAIAVLAEDAGSGSGTAVPIAKTLFSEYYLS